MATVSKLTVAETLANLSRDHQAYMRFLETSDFDVGMYRPDGVDDQTPHQRDELYVIARGNGEFVCVGDKANFGPGDVLFAPAGTDHRFVNFSKDFATWVIFFGKRE